MDRDLPLFYVNFCPVTLETFTNPLRRSSLSTADKGRILQCLRSWAESTPVRNEAYDYPKPATGVSIQKNIYLEIQCIYFPFGYCSSSYLYLPLHTTLILMTCWGSRRSCLWATLFIWDKLSKVLHCCRAGSLVQAKQYNCKFLSYRWYADLNCVIARSASLRQ